jgi:hypothetical protein
MTISAHNNAKTLAKIAKYSVFVKKGRKNSSNMKISDVVAICWLGLHQWIQIGFVVP